MIKSTDNLNVHVSPFYFVAQCVNRPSNYSCECDSGFEGDGTLGCTGKLSIGLNLLGKLLPFIFLLFRHWWVPIREFVHLPNKCPGMKMNNRHIWWFSFGTFFLSV